jgi:hypothetical protein
VARLPLVHGLGGLEVHVSIVEESGSVEDGCSVNRASMRPSCGLYALTVVAGTAAGEALARACAAGAIAASRPGAQPSLPTAAELDEILAR